MVETDERINVSEIKTVREIVIAGEKDKNVEITKNCMNELA